MTLPRTASLAILVLAVASFAGYLAMSMRVPTPPLEQFVPEGAHLAIRIQNLRTYWPQLAESRAVNTLLTSPAFAELERAEKLHFEIETRIHELKKRTNQKSNPRPPEMQPIPIMEFRRRLNEIAEFGDRHKVRLLSRQHVLDLLGRDVMIAVDFAAQGRKTNVAVILETGGRGYAVARLLEKNSPRLESMVGLPHCSGIYGIPDSPVVFSRIGSLLCVGNDKNWLKACLEHAAKADAPLAKSAPTSGATLFSAGADLSAIRALNGYHGNVLSSINAILLAATQPGANAQQGSGIDWLLDTLAIPHTLHIDLYESARFNATVTVEGLQCDATFTRGREAVDAYTQTLFAMPPSPMAAPALLPRDTLYFHEARIDFPAWIEDLHREARGAINGSLRDSSKTEREQALRDFEAAWDGNLRRIDDATPRDLQRDIFPQIGPLYGIAAIMPPETLGETPEIHLPGFVYFARIGDTWLPTAAEDIRLGIDAMLSDIDQHRMERGQAAIYQGIAEEPHDGTVIYDVQVNMANSGLQMYDSLDKNLRFGYMIYKGILFLATKKEVLEQILKADDSPLSGTDLFANPRECHAQLFVNPSPTAAAWRLNTPYLAQQHEEFSDYPEQLIERRKVYDLQASLGDALGPMTASFQWQDAQSTMHWRLDFPLPAEDGRK